MMDPAQVASGYEAISKIYPPPVTKPGWIEFLDLPLLRAVDPHQIDYLNELVRVRPNSAWEGVRAAVVGQRAIRQALHRHLLELDARLRDEGDAFIFPDPYSLLLWIWNFQLFHNLYTRPMGAVWTKYYYRGEARDYGNTRFQPQLARPNAPEAARDPCVPARARALIRSHALTQAMLWRQPLSIQLAQYLVGTMSCAQAVAIAQHYGFPTPLTDITVHPEIAAWFATSRSTGDVGVVGSWEIDVKGLQDFTDLAIIILPSVFTRVHLQSGYFICSKRAAIAPLVRLRPLRFYHCRELQPVQPTWLMLVGPVSGRGASGSDILEDPLQLESAFMGESPRELPTEFPKAPSLSEAELESVARTAAADLMIGAGRQGITEDGRRFIEIDHSVLYSMARHAPQHTYQYAAALLSHPKRNAFAPLSRALLKVFRVIIALAIDDDNNMNATDALALTENMTMEDIMRIAAAAVGPFDNHALNWPINSWYEPSVKAG
jgi:hypothetical protein